MLRPCFNYCSHKSFNNALIFFISIFLPSRTLHRALCYIFLKKHENQKNSKKKEKTKCNVKTFIPTRIEPCSRNTLMSSKINGKNVWSQHLTHFKPVWCPCDTDSKCVGKFWPCHASKSEYLGSISTLITYHPQEQLKWATVEGTKGKTFQIISNKCCTPNLAWKWAIWISCRRILNQNVCMPLLKWERITA